MEKQNRIVIIEGPSGAGKDSIINGLIKSSPNNFEKIISLCTREMRNYESQGNPYYFVDDCEFDDMVKSGDIFEWTTRHGKKRGMSEKYINKILCQNKIALKDCDLVGVNALRKRFDNVLAIFIVVSKAETERRMRKRGDPDDDIKKRLSDYDRHLTESKYYDIIIENKNLQETIDKVLQIVYNDAYMDKNKKANEIKVVCTIGPASEDEGTLKGLINAGMSIARCNFSHGSYDEHKLKFERIRKVSKELKKKIAIALDTKGPELRLQDFENPPIFVKSGDKFSFYCDGRIGYQNGVSVSNDNLYKAVKKGDEVAVADGMVKLVIENVVGKEIICSVVTGGKLGNKKNMNVVGVRTNLGMSFISEKDKNDLEFAVAEKMDYIFASFVQCAKDVRDMRKIVGGIPIISKIECKLGVDNLDEIIAESDGIMVARGDMGYEYPIEKIPTIQKMIIEKCNKAGKFVIVATEMMATMEYNPRPTRAEVTDVATAVYQGANAVMLSGESAMGKYPVETVTYMRKIIDEVLSQMAENN
jgi:pyruvate kinase